MQGFVAHIQTSSGTQIYLVACKGGILTHKIFSWNQIKDIVMELALYKWQFIIIILYKGQISYFRQPFWIFQAWDFFQSSYLKVSRKKVWCFGILCHNLLAQTANSMAYPSTHYTCKLYGLSLYTLRLQTVWLIPLHITPANWHYINQLPLLSSDTNDACQESVLLSAASICFLKISCCTAHVMLIWCWLPLTSHHTHTQCHTHT